MPVIYLRLLESDQNAMQMLAKRVGMPLTTWARFELMQIVNKTAPQAQPAGAPTAKLRVAPPKPAALSDADWLARHRAQFPPFPSGQARYDYLMANHPEMDEDEQAHRLIERDYLAQKGASEVVTFPLFYAYFREYLKKNHDAT